MSVKGGLHFYMLFNEELTTVSTNLSVEMQ